MWPIHPKVWKVHLLECKCCFPICAKFCPDPLLYRMQSQPLAELHTSVLIPLICQNALPSLIQRRGSGHPCCCSSVRGEAVCVPSISRISVTQRQPRPRKWIKTSRWPLVICFDILGTRTGQRSRGALTHTDGGRLTDDWRTRQHALSPLSIQRVS